MCIRDSRRAISTAIQKLASAEISGGSKHRIREWYNMRENTGSCDPERKRQNLNPLVSQEVKSFIEQKLKEDCDLQMSELSLLIWVEYVILINADTILKTVHELGYTWKVVEYVPLGRVLADRLEFRHILRPRHHGGLFSAEQFVIIDESHNRQFVH